VGVAPLCAARDTASSSGTRDDFALIAFHLEGSGIFAVAWVPVLYAGAMLVDAGSAVVLGKWYDSKGPRVLSVIAAATAVAVPLLFLGGIAVVVAGTVIWGLGMGAIEGVLRAGVSDLVPAHRRGAAFGSFHLVFGLAWFAGSALMGFLYDMSILALVVLAVAFHLVAAPVLWVVRPGADVSGEGPVARDR
jgi:predicted MFS family arabinose efflux permease